MFRLEYSHSVVLMASHCKSCKLDTHSLQLSGDKRGTNIRTFCRELTSKFGEGSGEGLTSSNEKKTFLNEISYLEILNDKEIDPKL